MPHFVYILYSASHDLYYVGESSDVERRIVFHNYLSQTGYTSKFRPWKLLLQMELPNHSSARRLEKHIKKQKNRGIITLLHSDMEYRKALIKKFSVG